MRALVSEVTSAVCFGSLATIAVNHIKVDQFFSPYYVGNMLCKCLSYLPSSPRAEVISFCSNSLDQLSRSPATPLIIGGISIAVYLLSNVPLILHRHFHGPLQEREFIKFFLIGMMGTGMVSGTLFLCYNEGSGRLLKEVDTLAVNLHLTTICMTAMIFRVFFDRLSARLR